jgi:hypothetical protein
MVYVVAVPSPILAANFCGNASSSKVLPTARLFVASKTRMSASAKFASSSLVNTGCNVPPVLPILKSLFCSLN